MKKIGFIGAGNMGGALILSICKAIDPQDVLIFDLDNRKASALSQKTGCALADSASQIATDCEYVVMAVKPQFLREVLSGIVPALKENSDNGNQQVLMSIAAGISVNDLYEIPARAGVDMAVVRMLPNTPAEVGKGLIIYTGNEKFTDEMDAEIKAIFAKCGLMDHVTEHIIDVASAISGCTPAFAYMFIDALADGAVRCGVPRDMAIRYAAQTVMGSAAMVLETGRHPDALKDAVCSPGGSTIVGVATLENGAFRASAANAVYFANEKNKDLGKK